jgi:hypothetical protein
MKTSVLDTIEIGKLLKHLPAESIVFQGAVYFVIPSTLQNQGSSADPLILRGLFLLNYIEIFSGIII